MTDADGVIVAVPAHAREPSARTRRAGAAAELARIEYASVALVTMAFDRSSAHRPLDGSGYLVPRTTGLLMTACSWASSKWAHLDNGEQVIVRGCRPGGSETSASFSSTTTRSWPGCSRSSRRRATSTAHPAKCGSNRWMRSFPQYEPGHLDLVDRIERQLAEEAPNVLVTGAAFRGLGVPACIRQGREAAAELIRRVGA